MKKEVLSQFGHPDLILFSFLLFLFCFLGVLAWTLQKGRKKYFLEMAQMPLQEEKGKSHE